MTNNKKIEIIEEAFIYYHDRNSLTNQEDKELKNLIDEIKQAINFTGSSLELPSKEDFILWNAPSIAVKDGVLIDEKWIDSEEEMYHDVFGHFMEDWSEQK